MTKNQIQIVNDFRNDYFRQDPLLSEIRCSLGEFLSKTEAERSDFINNWLISKISELKATKANLQSTLSALDAKIILYEEEKNGDFQS